MPKHNLVIHSGRSKQSEKNDQKNFYRSPEGRKLMQGSNQHQKNVQDLANDSMRKAMKEGRGMSDKEIFNVIDNIEFGYSHRPAVAANSKTSSAVKRYVGRKNKKTGRMEWIPMR